MYADARLATERLNCSTIWEWRTVWLTSLTCFPEDSSKRVARCQGLGQQAEPGARGRATAALDSVRGPSGHGAVPQGSSRTWSRCTRGLRTTIVPWIVFDRTIRMEDGIVLEDGKLVILRPDFEDAPRTIREEKSAFCIDQEPVAP